MESKFRTIFVKGGPDIDCSIPWLMAGVMGTAINVADVLNEEDIDRFVGFRDTSLMKIRSNVTTSA